MKEKEFNLSKIGTNELSSLLTKARKEAERDENFMLYYYWIISAQKEMRKRR